MSRLAAWEQRSELPLAGAALLFLLAYAVPIAWVDAPRAALSIATAAVALTWIAFGIDLAVRVHLADRRWAYLRRHWFDLVILVVPVFRPLRLLRLVTVVALLNRVGSHGLRGQVVAYVAGGAGLLLLVAALAVTEAERGVVDAPIQNLGDGFWWALTTMTTVGYGDMYPVTVTGRFVAAALMVGGIALLGTVTATVASWLVERVSNETGAEQAATRAQVESLTEEVRLLRTQLAGRQE